MTVVLWIAASMLGIAAVLSIVRIVRGPSALDRAVAMDVLLSCAIGGIGLEAAYGRHGTTIPVLAVLALLGFVGSVAIARFGAGLGDDDPDPGSDGPAHDGEALR
jgi:multicomponent Na+:H+ antiporter subunit F